MREGRTSGPSSSRGPQPAEYTLFASILAYTEHNFVLAPLGVNDGDAHSFLRAFNYSKAPVPVVSRHVPPSDHIGRVQSRQVT